jgi:hypothetical protein
MMPRTKARGHYSKRENELIATDGRPLEPPRMSDIEGRPGVGTDELLAALIKHHPEKDPANTKLDEDHRGESSC